MNPTYDEIQSLSEEKQEQFHKDIQRSLRKQWAESRNQIEKEIDNDRKCQGK